MPEVATNNSGYVRAHDFQVMCHFCCLQTARNHRTGRSRRREKMMDVRNRMADVVKLRCNACQDFLRMILKEGWQQELYKSTVRGDE